MNYTSIPLKDRSEPITDRKIIHSVMLQMSRALIGNYEFYPKKLFNESLDFFFWDFSLDEEGKYFTALSRIIEKISGGITTIKRLSILDFTRETGITPETNDCYFIRRFENSYQKNIFILDNKGLVKPIVF